MSLANAPDPITVEILANALASVTDEAFITLMKASYSTNIKERHDHSTAIMDVQGRLIVQAEQSLPIHLASMSGLMQCLLARYPLESIVEGDIFVANDPHVAGGTHLPDINMATPVFAQGKLLAFVCNIAHHADVGGMAPGSMAGGMSEIYQEGLRIPVVRLFTAGELEQDLFDVLLLNVRLPAERRGDWFAQVASCRTGARRLAEIVERQGAELLLAVFEEIVQRSERRMRECIGSIPDGEYSFTDVMDDDGLGATDIPITVTIRVTDDRILFDFSGSAPQVQGNINLTTNATQSAICYTLKAMLDPDIPNNHGVLEVCEFITEPGSLLDCRFPAPVAARAHTCQRVVDVIIGALAQALPEQAVAAANGANTTAVFSGRDPRTGNDYLYLETLGGGFGGRATRDGTDGVQVHITNTSNLPVEAIEMEYPLRVESYGFVADSGGAGRHRGGLGLRRVITPVEHDCVFNGAGERFRNAPWGLFGGESGERGSFVHERTDAKTTPLDNKPNAVRVLAGERVIVQTPGAGGYGPAAQRDEQAITADELSGKFSAQYLQEHYRK
ncbi:MAG: N-methylhydantoinase B [Gammaproteobacteria bacterium]|jgi:N-methylhydantoinase B